MCFSAVRSYTHRAFKYIYCTPAIAACACVTGGTHRGKQRKRKSAHARTHTIYCSALFAVVLLSRFAREPPSLVRDLRI